MGRPVLLVDSSVGHHHVYRVVGLAPRHSRVSLDGWVVAGARLWFARVVVPFCTLEVGLWAGVGECGTFSKLRTEPVQQKRRQPRGEVGQNTDER